MLPGSCTSPLAVAPIQTPLCINWNIMLSSRCFTASRQACTRASAPASARQVLSATRPWTTSRRRVCIVRAGGQVSTNDFKTGLNVEVDGVPWKVVEFLHVKPGKGSAFVRSKLKNYITGGVVEKTFRAGEMLGVPDLSKREAQFTYMEGDEFVFMDTQSYEETRLKRDDWANFLKEGANCELLFYNGKVLSVEPPAFVELEVVECPPGVKGNTASGGGTKPAKLETGATVQVPLFIDAGGKIKVDTRTGTYLSKA